MSPPVSKGPLYASTSDVVDGDGEVHFDSTLFNGLVRSKGIQFSHYVAIPCAGSDTNTEDIRSNHYGHSCSNGFFYKKVPDTFTSIFTNNPSSKYFKAEGIIDSATSWVIVPRTYDKSNKLPYFSPYDRVYIESPEFCQILVPTFERLEMSQTGIEKARFPIVEVQYLMDSNEEMYEPGIDFIVSDGNIRWISTHRPQWNQKLNVGTPYSIRYLYRPFWYVASVEHEIRISKALDDNGEEQQVRLPSYLRCIREIFFRDKENNPNNDGSPREGIAPPSGSNLGSYR